MPLSLDACAVGNVTIIRCTGRIVAGADADALRRRVSALLPDCREIVLHLGNVALVDSTGMGTLARLLISARRCGGDLRLCNVGGEVLKVLQITRLNTLFQILQSEEDAVSSFSQGMPGRHAARV
jgi:anti-sigma B factor antagonist